MYFICTDCSITNLNIIILYRSYINLIKYTHQYNILNLTVVTVSLKYNGYNICLDLFNFIR